MAFEDGSGGNLGSLWGYLGSTCGIWGDFGANLGVTLRSLCGYFGVTLGSIWVSVRDFGAVDGYFAMIVE